MKSKEHSADTENKLETENTSEETQSMAEALPDAGVEEQDPISKMETELTDARDKYLRLYSDFENFKKRVARDKVEQMKMAGSDIFLSILPVIDDFERALKSFETAKEIGPVKEGLSLIYSKMKSITESRGLKPMDAKGKPFDADLHDAITNVPAPTEDQKGMVIEEVERGYFLNDKVIRHAKVIVGN